MDRKEEIILVTLELAAKNGLSSVSMSQIASKIGIKKPSLYNHFKSKEEIITAMYQYLRDKSKENMSLTDIDYGEFIKGKTLEEILTQSVSNYIRMNEDEKMTSFYKVIYSERAINIIAAKIMADETKRMILTTKNLFYLLNFSYIGTCITVGSYLYMNNIMIAQPNGYKPFINFMIFI